MSYYDIIKSAMTLFDKQPAIGTWSILSNKVQNILRNQGKDCQTATCQTLRSDKTRLDRLES